MSRYRAEMERVFSFVAGTLFWGGLIAFGFAVSFKAAALLFATLLGLEIYRRLA